MVKKYIIAVDTNVRPNNKTYKVFMFKKEKMYNTKKEAETRLRKKIKEVSDSDPEKPVYFTIIPIYTKK